MGSKTARYLAVAVLLVPSLVVAAPHEQAASRVKDVVLLAGQVEASAYEGPNVVNQDKGHEEAAFNDEAEHQEWKEWEKNDVTLSDEHTEEVKVDGSHKLHEEAVQIKKKPDFKTPSHRPGKVAAPKMDCDKKIPHGAKHGAGKDGKDTKAGNTETPGNPKKTGKDGKPEKPRKPGKPESTEKAIEGEDIAGAPSLGDNFVPNQPGQASVYNACPYAVYLNIVGEGYNGGRQALAQGATSSHSFKATSNGGISIKVSKAGADGISQFEYYLNEENNKVFWDLSHVNGEPFQNDGVALLPFPNANSNSGNCRSALCNAGEDCPASQAYGKPDDHLAMRDCSAETEIVMITCSGDEQIALRAWKNTSPDNQLVRKSRALGAFKQIAAAGQASRNAAKKSASGKNVTAFSLVLATVGAGFWLLA